MAQASPVSHRGRWAPSVILVFVTDLEGSLEKLPQAEICPSRGKRIVHIKAFSFFSPGRKRKPRGCLWVLHVPICREAHMCLWCVCQALNQFSVIALCRVEGLGWYLGLWHTGTDPSLSTCTIEPYFSFPLLLWEISFKNIYWSDAGRCSSVRPHLQPEPEPVRDVSWPFHFHAHRGGYVTAVQESILSAALQKSGEESHQEDLHIYLWVALHCHADGAG